MENPPLVFYANPKATTFQFRLRQHNTTESFNHPVDVFEILYNLSVGIERLLKVAIVLIEHNDEVTNEEFEKSLITHNTQALLERLNEHKDLNLTHLNWEFVALLSKFYKSHRYARYSLRSVLNIAQEKIQFLEFISKHLHVDFDVDDEFAPLVNTDQIKRFIGKIVKRIARSIFSVIQEQASRFVLVQRELESRAF